MCSSWKGLSWRKHELDSHWEGDVIYVWGKLVSGDFQMTKLREKRGCVQKAQLILQLIPGHISDANIWSVLHINHHLELWYWGGLVEVGCFYKKGRKTKDRSMPKLISCYVCMYKQGIWESCNEAAMLTVWLISLTNEHCHLGCYDEWWFKELFHSCCCVSGFVYGTNSCKCEILWKASGLQACQDSQG